jgi:hypothetical protein
MLDGFVVIIFLWNIQFMAIDLSTKYKLSFQTMCCTTETHTLYAKSYDLKDEQEILVSPKRMLNSVQFSIVQRFL